MFCIAAQLTIVFSTLVLASDVFIAAVFLILILSLCSRKVKAFREGIISRSSRYLKFLAFMVALVSTLGSLYYSEIAGYDPCRLCWFQRIMMYPLVILLGVSIWKKDRNVWNYVVPMSVIGSLIAVYHYYIQVAASKAASACSSSGGVSCASSPFFSYGYITIPMMALTGFGLILIAFLGTFFAKKKEEKMRANR